MPVCHRRCGVVAAAAAAGDAEQHRRRSDREPAHEPLSLKQAARGYDWRAEPAVPSFVLDLAETTRPVLHPLVEQLLADERLAAYADALPASARVSEPVLPLVLAGLHEHLGRGLVVLLPEDADARDAAEAARWLLGAERVALLPSRGVRWGSGLEPPPHLVGERARALDVLAAGGLVCCSAAALAEPLPPPEARPEPITVSRSASPGLDALAEQLALAGYERVDR